MDRARAKTSPVLSFEEMREVLNKFGSPRVNPTLVARQPLLGKLRYSFAPVRTYLENFCGVQDNDCPDSYFEKDCTHFVTHALNRGDVLVQDSSATCSRDLCIRVEDLAASFHNSVGRYSNVKQITSHSTTRAGDFCFLVDLDWWPDKDHAMVLAGKATSTGANVFGHSNERCGTRVSFNGIAAAYYRIEETS